MNVQFIVLADRMIEAVPEEGRDGYVFYMNHETHDSMEITDAEYKGHEIVIHNLTTEHKVYFGPDFRYKGKFEY